MNSKFRARLQNETQDTFVTLENVCACCKATWLQQQAQMISLCYTSVWGRRLKLVLTVEIAGCPKGSFRAASLENQFEGVLLGIRGKGAPVQKNVW